MVAAKLFGRKQEDEKGRLLSERFDKLSQQVLTGLSESANAVSLYVA